MTGQPDPMRCSIYGERAFAIKPGTLPVVAKPPAPPIILNPGARSESWCLAHWPAMRGVQFTLAL